jgi:Restriction endonuclease
MPAVQRCKYKGCHTLVERPTLCCAKHKQYEQELKEQRERYSRSRYNKYTRNQNEQKKEQYNFYRKKRLWGNLRLACLKRDNYICLYCLAIGKVTANSKTADHVVPIEANPKLKAELSNLATCCRDCHNLKTIWEREHYGTGQGNQLTHAKEITDIKIISNLMRR